MAIPVYRKIPIDQYNAIEEEDQQRYEYHEGELYVVNGGTLRHEIIASNVMLRIGTQLLDRDSKCRTFNAGVKIEVKDGLRYVYPDGAVICDEALESGTVIGSVKNPIAIIEVLSQGTQTYDWGLKARLYRSLPSVRAYILLTQTQPSATIYQRKNHLTLWSCQDFYDLSDVLFIDCINVPIPLSQIYRDVKFDPIGDDFDPSQLLYEPITPYGQP